MISLKKKYNFVKIYIVLHTSRKQTVGKLNVSINLLAFYITARNLAEGVTNQAAYPTAVITGFSFLDGKRQIFANTTKSNNCNLFNREMVQTAKL